MKSCELPKFIRITIIRSTNKAIYPNTKNYIFSKAKIIDSFAGYLLASAMDKRCGDSFLVLPLVRE